MKSDLLMDAMGLIDDEMVKDAAEPAREGRRFTLKRCIAVAVAAVLCLTVVAIPALAAFDVEPAYNVLYSVSPAAAQKLKPVRMSCEDRGIKMEVVSAAVIGDRADIYVSMRDMTGDRIDGTTDLFDSYSINRPFDSGATCQLESYDPATGTASFLISITQFGGRNITGDKITFSVDRFLSHKSDFSGPLESIDPASAPTEPLVRTDYNLRGGAFGDGGVEGRMPVLMPDPNVTFSPVTGAEITAIGYVDGRLHIQAWYEDIRRTDNHGFIYLQNAGGERLDCELSLSFWDDDELGSYEEYVFDISPEEAAGCQVMADITTCGMLTEGDWQVTFPLTEN